MNTILALSTFGAVGIALMLLAAVVVIALIVRRARSTHFTSIASDQPATGALPTPPVGVDDEPMSVISRRPAAPIFVVAIPRDHATLEVSFALPPHTPTPNGIEVLVNES